MRTISLIALFLIAPAFVFALQQVEFKMEFGQEGSGPGQMREPSDVAVDSAEGHIYVADKDNKRIHVMSYDGKTIAMWNSKSGEWAIEEPSGIAVYEGKVYVADSSLNKVLIFSKEGNFIDEFGSSGIDQKQFDNPKGICVHQGIIYVADTGNHRIQSFSLEGIYLSSIGTKGSGIGEMRSPTDVAVGYDGYIYITEAGNNRVGVYSPSGKHHRYYYDIEEPSSIVIDSNGFFVADAGNYKVKKFDFEGRLLLSFGTEGGAQSQFRAISGIALDREGKVFVVDSKKNTVQIFSPEKTASIPPEFSPPLNSVKWLRDINTNADVEDIVWDKDTLYATSAKEDAVIVIQEGVIRRFIRGDSKNSFNDPSGIAIDPQGFLWVVDSGNSRIVRIGKDGAIVSVIGGSGSKEGFFSSPQGIAISPKGLVYVADTGNERVQIFNTSGVFMNMIEKFGATIDKEEFDKPVDVGLDVSGNIFVVDEGANRVVKLDSQGRVLLSIGREGEGKGEFKKPNSILVTREEIFILDSGNNRVQVFDHKGRFLRKFGARGKGKGDFLEPTSLAMKDETTIFISDRENKAVQELGLVYTPQFPLQLKAEGDVKAINLSWPKNFEIYFSHYNIYRSEDKITFKQIGTSSEPLFVDKAVKPDTPYFYRISAVAKQGNESAKGPATEGVAKKFIPQPPTGIKASATETEILLSWQQAKEEDVALYTVYRETDEAFKEMGRVKTATFTDRGLNPNTTYNYKITALSAGNEESQGAFIKTATIMKKPLTPPTDIKASAGESEISLNWQPDREEDVALYIVYRETDGAFKEIGRVKTPTFTDRGLKPNSTYNYKITALSADNRESRGAFINAATIMKKPLTPPTDIKASAGESEISLNWQPDREEDVALYIVYRETDGAFKEIGRVKTPTFTDRGLKPNSTYNYKITALSADNRESRGAFINAATILKKPPIDVTVLKMGDIFSRAYKIYERDGIGKIRIANNTAKSLSNIRVSFMTKEFMENPAEVEIKEIKPWEGFDVDLKPSFSNKIFSLTENKSIPAEIKITYLMDGEMKSYSMTYTLIAIPTGRRYTEADAKRLIKAVNALNEKVLKKKAENDVVKKIKESFDVSDSLINKLKARDLSYGEIIVCAYLSNQTGKSPDEILTIRTAGQNWPEIMSIYDVGINDITYTLNEIEKGIGIREKPKPKEKRRETEKFFK